MDDAPHNNGHVPWMPILIRKGDFIATLMIPVTATVHDLKLGIRPFCGTPSAGNQKLLFGNVSLEEDTRLLSDYGISNGSAVDIEQMIRIGVRVEDNIHWLTLSINTTIREWKEEIMRNFLEDNNIDMNSIKLRRTVHGVVFFMDDNATVVDSLDSDDVVDLVIEV